MIPGFDVGNEGQRAGGLLGLADKHRFFAVANSLDVEDIRPKGDAFVLKFMGSDIESGRLYCDRKSNVARQAGHGGPHRVSGGGRRKDSTT